MSPSSVDAILARLDAQDKTLERIEKHAERTNGRVSRLELWKERTEAAAKAAATATAQATSWRLPTFVAVVGALVGAVAVKLLGG